MSSTIPFLTAYDPVETGEGSLDPLGLYQLADQLAGELAPGIRERMQRIRFLTMMALGSVVTETLPTRVGDEDDVPPFMAWEWLVVESLVRSRNDQLDRRAVPGTMVTARALDQHGYLDRRSYLKTARIYGFHGVYKRLAVRLNVVDVHMGSTATGHRLLDAWAKDAGLGNLDGATEQVLHWREAVRRCLAAKSPQTRPAWKTDDWEQLAAMAAPNRMGRHEKQALKALLHAEGQTSLGALRDIWALYAQADGQDLLDEVLHPQLAEANPSYRQLLEAIRCYEAFCRSLQDGFDLLRAEASGRDARGLEFDEMSGDAEVAECAAGLASQYADGCIALGRCGQSYLNLFQERFEAFAQPLSPVVFAETLCGHHEGVQKAKGGDGKRPWFDRLGPQRIYMRQRYRQGRSPIAPGAYVHDYRSRPIRAFYDDLEGGVQDG